jgi:hypothetical protein
MARHNKRFRLLVAALALLLSGLFGSSRAAAYEEQVSVDAALGYALLTGPDSSSRQGLGAELGAGIGLSDVVVLRGTVGYAALLRKDDVEQVGRLRLEAIYLLDVLQVVPFFGLGLTLTTAQETSARVPLRPGGQLVVGLDYLLTRSWICGLDVRAALLVDGSELLSATDVSLRLSRMFETF